MREVGASRIHGLLPGQAASSWRGVGRAGQRSALPTRRRPRAPHAGPVPAGTLVGRRGWLAFSAVVIGVLLTLLAYPRRAGAHALLVRSQPVNGSTVAAALPVLRLWFDEEISPTLSSARLVDRGSATVAGTTSIAGRTDPRLLEMNVPALGPGTYGVLWRVLAEDDGHLSSGTVVFSVGAADGPLAVDANSTATTPLDVARRWIGVSLLAGLIGGLAVTGLVLTRIDRDWASPVGVAARLARRRILRVAGWCAVSGVVVGVIDAIEQARRLSTPAQPWTSAVDDLIFSARWGHLWLAREAALLALVPIVFTIRARSAHPPRRRSLALCAAALVVVLVSAEALNSHAATVSSARGAAVVSDAVHILAACVWLGALPALALILWPWGGDHRVGTASLVRACAGPFTRLVATSVALVLATGLYNAGREVESVGDLGTTSYGRTLLIKSALLVLMVGVGLVNATRLDETRRAVQPKPSLTRRLVLVEAAVGAVLLLAVGVLVNTAPGRGSTQATDAVARTGSASVADLLITVSVTPNRPGINGFTVLASSSRRPPPATVDGVTLELNRAGGATAIPLAPTAPGTYFGTGQFDGAGPLRLRTVVHRAGTQLAATIPWTVSPVSETRPGAARRLSPYVNVLALCVIAAFVASAAALYRRRGRAEPLTPPPAEPKIDSLV
jgi:copper transport protein